MFGKVDTWTTAPTSGAPATDGSPDSPVVWDGSLETAWEDLEGLSDTVFIGESLVLSWTANAVTSALAGAGELFDFEGEGYEVLVKSSMIGRTSA